MIHDLDGIMFTILMSIYIFLIFCIKKSRIKFIHETSVAILIGLLFGIYMRLIHGKYLNVNPIILFDFILPPIIMNAAKNLNYNLFFSNFHYIFWFGCVGTFITFLGFFAFIDLFATLGAFPALQDAEGQLLAAALTATETVGVQTLIKEKEMPDLHSIIFGEGIINDAVAIQLFKAINNMIQTPSAENGGAQQNILSQHGFTGLFAEFLYCSSLSFFIGVSVGLLQSYLFKQMRISTEESALEISQMFLFAYFSYLIPEAFSCSGIMSLFSYIVVIQNYGSLNMSKRSQKVFFFGVFRKSFLGHTYDIGYFEFYC